MTRLCIFLHSKKKGNVVSCHRVCLEAKFPSATILKLLPHPHLFYSFLLCPYRLLPSRSRIFILSSKKDISLERFRLRELSQELRIKHKRRRGKRKKREKRTLHQLNRGLQTSYRNVTFRKISRNPIDYIFHCWP